MAETTKKASSGKSKAAAAPKAAADATPAGDACQVAGCKQPVRAKGYCRKHFMAWRRGDIGKKHRYKICSKEGCRKPALAGGKCEEHKKGAAPAEAAAAG
jgi:hypothetical protein